MHIARSCLKTYNVLMSSPVVKNAAYITISSISLKIIAFLYFGFIANLLEPAQTGQYFIALAIFGVLQVFDDLGTTPWLIRHVAGQKNAQELIPHISAIKLVTVPLAILFAFLAPYALGYSDVVRTLVQLGALIIISDTISQTNFGILRGLQLLKYESIGIFIGQSITAISGILFLLFVSQAPIFLILALVLGSTWNAFFSTYIALKHISWRAYLPAWKGAWALVAGASAFFIANIFTRVFAYADTFLISIIMGEYQLGIYSVAYKLTYAFQFLPLALVAALYPALSHAVEDDIASRKLVEGSLRYLSLIGFPIVGGIFAIAEPLLAVYAAPEYQAALLPLRVLIFALIFTFLDFPIGSLLNARMRHKTKTVIMGLTLVLNVAMNLVLIPLYGLLGASIAAVCSFAFMFFVGLMAVQPVLRIPLSLIARTVAVPAFGASLMALAVLFSGLNVYLSIVFGAIVYVIVIFGTKYMTFSEIRGWRS